MGAGAPQLGRRRVWGGGSPPGAVDGINVGPEKTTTTILQNPGTSTAKQKKINTRKNIPNKATYTRTIQH